MSGLLENPRKTPYRDIITTVAESEYDSFSSHPESAQLPEKLHNEAVNYLEELGLDIEPPSQPLVWEEEIKTLHGDFLGAYNNRSDKAALKVQPQLIGGPFSTTAHEIIHADQYKKIIEPDYDETPEEVLEKHDLSTDLGDNGEDIYTETPFIEDILSKTGFSAAEIAQTLQYEDAREDFLELNNAYNKNVETQHERFVRELNNITEKENQEYEKDPSSTEEALDILSKGYKVLENALEDNTATRLRSPRIGVELEGFAHYISSVIEDKRFSSRARSIEKHYERELENGQTVGEKASERLLELEKVHENLTSYGDMSDGEAVKYVMEEVQPKKFEYADKVNPSSPLE